MESLPFQLVGMSYEEFMEEIENVDVNPIPSDDESVVEEESENEAQNIDNTWTSLVIG